MPKPAVALAGIVATLAMTLSAVAFPAELTRIERDHKIRVLVVTGGHSFDHTEFFQMFDAQPDIVWTEAKLPADIGCFAPEKAGDYDVMVWYGFGQKGPDEQTQKNIKALLDGGKPLIVLHHGMSTFPSWDEAEKIVGARYILEAKDGHEASTWKHDVKIPVKIADKSHPITRGMEDFEILDETYGKVPILPGVKPLLTTDHPESMPMLGWTHTYGKSTVVFLAGGHGPTAYRDRNFVRLLMQAIRFQAGALPDQSEEGFTRLFNGKNFDGWKIMGKPKGFWVKDGVIRSESKKGGNWMRPNKPYTNFVLRLQWRVGDGGNSGVFVRATEDGNPWVTGTEIQISNEYRDPPHCTGALYGRVAVNPRPDERCEVWHDMEVQCDGYRYKVFADNIPIIDVDGRLAPELAGRPLTGFIGLQDAHNRQSWIEFRNVRVKELPMSKGGAALWRVGTQTYTFHKYSLFEAIDKARALGLNCIELFPGQALSPDKPNVKFYHNSPKETRDLVRHKLQEAGITATSFGVVNFKPDEARKVFEFARDMEIATIVSEPENTPEMWDTLDKLTQEFKIDVAVHNHPAPSIYWDPKVLAKAIEGRNPRIGACADIGHWMRSGVDPMEALRLLDGRIIESHFKDLNVADKDGHDVPWGTGKGNAKAVMAELNRQGFSGVYCIEYEHNWLNSMPEIAECIKFFNQVTKELSASPK